MDTVESTMQEYITSHAFLRSPYKVPLIAKLDAVGGIVALVEQ